MAAWLAVTAAAGSAVAMVALPAALVVAADSTVVAEPVVASAVAVMPAVVLAAAVAMLVVAADMVVADTGKFLKVLNKKGPSASAGGPLCQDSKRNTEPGRHSIMGALWRVSRSFRCDLLLHCQSGKAVCDAFGGRRVGLGAGCCGHDGKPLWIGEQSGKLGQQLTRLV